MCAQEFRVINVGGGETDGKVGQSGDSGICEGELGIGSHTEGNENVGKQEEL